MRAVIIGTGYVGLAEALKDSDLCLIFTEWDEVKQLPVESYKSMRRPIVIDGRNCYNPEQFSSLGVCYESIGRTVINDSTTVERIEY
jgi:UDPglucose 6-dehydrogenase